MKSQIPNPESQRLRPRRWGLILALGLTVLGFGLWGLGFLSQPQDEAWARIRARGVIVVATDASYPPFSAVDADGNLFGFDIDLGDEIGRRLGVRVDYDNLTYDALLPALVAGRDDAVISAFVPQPERLKEVWFTRPYFTAGTVVVSRTDDRARTTDNRGWLSWASGRTLAVEYGAGGDVVARRWARETPAVTVLAKPTAQEALAALAAGEAQAALVDVITAYEFLKGQPGLALAGPPVDPEPYAIAVSARSRELFQVLERALDEMERDGTLTALKVKWFGESVVSDQSGIVD